MAIFINKVRVTANSAIGFISDPDDLARKLVRTWQRSTVAHCFDNQGRFIMAVHRNREFLRSKARREIRAFFTSSNYLFSTKAEDREETLYFIDRDTKRTGRLRQQHPKGPLAKIDTKPRTHRFLSKSRFESVRKWHHKNKQRLPFFYKSEKQKGDFKYHVEFSCDGKRISGWHSSGGTIRKSTQHLERRIDRALKEILGIVQNSGSARKS